MDEATLNRLSGDRLQSRHIDELSGVARGLAMIDPLLLS